MNSPVDRLLDNWRKEPTIAANLAAWQEAPARQPVLAPFPVDLHPALRLALRSQGVHSLYSHQSQAWQASQSGDHLVIVTGTASGKTLAYNLPVLDRLLRDPDGRALYLFPTKALAQDQKTSLEYILNDLELQNSVPAVAAYDGDTPASRRSTIRRNARIVISNPDMLHTAILPHHTLWADFFSNLSFVVIDEMHSYRGVFGSHVANVLRRLKRIAHHYGAHPLFILTSATIGNPDGLAAALVEEEVTLIDMDGSARGPQSFLIYNPPVVDTRLGLRASALGESLRLADDLLAYGVQTILFGRSRRTVEFLLTYLRQRSVSTDPARAIRGYRSGYLPAHRREIEAGLRSGEVRAVAATNALELGINIGQMGASLLVGFPGTVAAARQQAGRAGREQEHSLAVLVVTPDPLDQFLAVHPEYLFERTPEQALINPDHILILLDHLRCAAFELPFTEGETFGRLPAATLVEYLAFLQDQGILHHSAGRFFWMSDQYPAQTISLRTASSETVLLQAEGDEDSPTRLVGQVDFASALWMVHPGAVYLHEAQTYLVDDLDLVTHTARLSPVAPDYFTEPIHSTDVQKVNVLNETEVSGCTKTYGELLVTDQVVGFRRLRWNTQEVLGASELDLPPFELQTTGYWLALSETTLDGLRQAGLWRGDPNRYGQNWKKQKERARLRDDYCCQVCGTRETVQAHDVHHIVPFRTFTGCEQANQLSNLVTLCPACHQRAETSVRIRSGLAGLSYVLTHLAPLFLMCDIGDLGGYNQPQSPLADGRPVVALYDQAPAGIGFSAKLYEIHSDLLASASELVVACPCQDGCPSCVGPGGENGLGGKQETLALLASLNR